MPLISLAEAKNFLQISSTTDDGRLSNLITFVSNTVSSYCGRNFEANNFMESFDGGVSSVFVSNVPLNNVAQVTEYDGVNHNLLANPNLDGSLISVSGAAHTITFNNSTYINTRVKKWGKSSLRLNGGYLSSSASEDWGVFTDTGSILSQVRFDTNIGIQTIISQGNGSSYWALVADFSGANVGLKFNIVSSGTELISLQQNDNRHLGINQFFDIGITKDQNSTYRLLHQGNVAASLTSSNTIPDFVTGQLEIGRNAGSVNNIMTGYMQDLKISWLPNITSATSLFPYFYSNDSETKLLLHFQGANAATSTNDSSRTVNDYTWYEDTGEIYLTSDAKPELSIAGTKVFKNYPKGIKVYYNGGYTTIPNDLKLACLELTKILHKGLEGSQSVSLSGESMNQFLLSSDNFPPQVKRILNLYKLW